MYEDSLSNKKNLNKVDIQREYCGNKKCSENLKHILIIWAQLFKANDIVS